MEENHVQQQQPAPQGDQQSQPSQQSNPQQQQAGGPPGAPGEGGKKRRRRRRRRGRGGGGGGGTGGGPQNYRELARRRFGIEELRPEQVEAIEAILAGKDTMAVLPTGYGKSLIYQVPSLLVQRPTIVISPLIALMADQERSLKRRNVPVIRIDSSLKAAERRAAFERLAQGGPLVVLTTPETLQSEKVGPAFENAKPALFCVDEAHCISEWGHDFRPSYLRLGEMRKKLGNPPMIALTATATPRVQQEIFTRLGLTDPKVVVAPPYRENLELSALVVPGNLKTDAVAKLLRRLRRPGIVYCATTVAVDSIWRALNRAQIPTARYHGKLADIERAAAQKRFMKPSKRIVMVATSAFGMGIDKPNIRYVVHYHAPGSLEQYVQEAGRAGRDGLHSRCVLLFDPADLDIQEHLQSRSRANVGQLVRVADALAAWASENKEVTVKALALSASVPANTAGALVAQLEALGLLRELEGGYVAAVPAEELARRAKELAGRLETLRSEDKKRLAHISEYSYTLDCRSIYIRKYFGEADPPPCGRCDRCKEKGILKPLPGPSVELSSEAEIAAANAADSGEDEEVLPQRPGKRRRGRGERQHRHAQQGQPQQGQPQQAQQAQPQPGQPQQGQPLQGEPGEGRKRRRRRRRRRGRGGGQQQPGQPQQQGVVPTMVSHADAAFPQAQPDLQATEAEYDEGELEEGEYEEAEGYEQPESERMLETASDDIYDVPVVTDEQPFAEAVGDELPPIAPAVPQAQASRPPEPAPEKVKRTPAKKATRVPKAKPAAKAKTAATKRKAAPVKKKATKAKAKPAAAPKKKAAPVKKKAAAPKKKPAPPKKKTPAKKKKR